jgi:hypothetical protein
MTYPTPISTPIAAQFYPFTPSVAKKLREAGLSAAEWRFWAYLTEYDPWGDRYKELDPLDIMRKCGIGKATYYRAKAKLQDLGLFDFQESKVSVRNLEGISKMRGETQKSESSLKNETEKLEMRLESQKRENQPLKSALSKVSTTLQTFSDLLKTLSEGMRESFEKFCLKKIQECSFKIGSRTAWLNKHGADYLEEFKETYSYALANPELIPPKTPFPMPDIASLKRMYKGGWKDAAIHFGLIDPNSPEEEIQNESKPVAPCEVMEKQISSNSSEKEIQNESKPVAPCEVMEKQISSNSSEKEIQNESKPVAPCEVMEKQIADSDNSQEPIPPAPAADYQDVGF